MTINNALSLETALRDAIAMFNFLGFASELYKKSNAVSDTFAVRRNANAAWSVYDGLVMKQNTEFMEGGYKLQYCFKPFVDQSHEILGRCRDPSLFPTPFSDCLYLIWFCRFSLLNLLLSCELVEKRQNRRLAPDF